MPVFVYLADSTMALRLNLSKSEYEQLLKGFHAFRDIGVKTGHLSDGVSQQLYVITAGQVY